MHARVSSGEGRGMMENIFRRHESSWLCMKFEMAFFARHGILITVLLPSFLEISYWSFHTPPPPRSRFLREIFCCIIFLCDYLFNFVWFCWMIFWFHAFLLLLDLLVSGGRVGGKEVISRGDANACMRASSGDGGWRNMLRRSSCFLLHIFCIISLWDFLKTVYVFC